MPEAILKPQKRILGDSTKAHENLQPVSPNATKKRKLEADQPSIITRPRLQDGFRKAATPASSQSQHKSKFVEEVLEKLTQDISGLKESNAEKDQQWERPSLDDFDPMRDSLCFQQIEAEEGPFSGDQTAVRLFGVTEVRSIKINLASRRQ
ncbi:DNA polymerase delta catalytic subunit [Coccidioides immitis H538.4]|uniref:DNA polymerase delta catalytic subunit n=1 Tax=Coccidioides immitis H538.4 TaxID=396776 RepID=A0A0J8UEZ2_COCIT|nr:DNA polymerase delta catalytic subunit [Coccidioides immitis H538.4]